MLRTALRSARGAHTIVDRGVALGKSTGHRASPLSTYCCSPDALAAPSSNRSVIGSIASKHHQGIAENRCYSSSRIVYAKKGGKDKGDKAAADAAVEVDLPDLKQHEASMDKKLQRMTEDFNKIRAGKATTDMFNHILIEAYGAKVPMSEAGQVTLKTPTQAAISVFDPDLVSLVANAIRDSGMSLNPSIEGTSILVTIPKPSKEARDNLVKTAQKISEKVRSDDRLLCAYSCVGAYSPRTSLFNLYMKTKQDVRQVRKDFLDAVKKAKSAISEDETRRLSKDVSSELTFISHSFIHIEK
jgi:ribosome recycling factor